MALSSNDRAHRGSSGSRRRRRHLATDERSFPDSTLPPTTTDRRSVTESGTERNRLLKRLLDGSTNPDEKMTRFA